MTRVRYRLCQLWRALLPQSRLPTEEQLRAYLLPEQVALFRRMQPSEQAHAFAVFERLRRSGQRDADLLTAALLHDVGKSLVPLTPWEKAIVVLAKRFFPNRWINWARSEAKGWRRAFVVALRHPSWGADLAEAAGVSPRACDLIRRHQESSSTDDLLRLLQQADEAE
ncbi:MAG: HD domain-containing protein [Anaerolineales bacterium]|nr:HD domain-containing protein [Anaerolineales bacterium]MCX7608660.1 HD domain-containing protein [Anaerolineales bacterium]MDW8226222.1 HD domain-containing protein [Anaerolineales bacterium]